LVFLVLRFLIPEADTDDVKVVISLGKNMGNMARKSGKNWKIINKIEKKTFT